MNHSLSSLEDRIGALEIGGRAIMFGDGALEATMGLWPATTNPYGSGCRGLSEQDGALEAVALSPRTYQMVCSPITRQGPYCVEPGDQARD